MRGLNDPLAVPFAPAIAIQPVGETLRDDTPGDAAASALFQFRRVLAGFDGRMSLKPRLDGLFRFRNLLREQPCAVPQGKQRRDLRLGNLLDCGE